MGVWTPLQSRVSGLWTSLGEGIECEVMTSHGTDSNTISAPQTEFISCYIDQVIIYGCLFCS